MPTATAMVRKIPNSICYVIELKLINHWILKILHFLEGHKLFQNQQKLFPFSLGPQLDLKLILNL